MTLPELRQECKQLGIAYTQKETKNQLIKKIEQFKMRKKTEMGDITPEQIEAWKKKHKTDKLHVVRVKVSEDDIAVGFLKPPKRHIKATALSMYSQHKILECGEFLRDNCWLGGDERLKTDEDIADSAAIQCSNIVKFLDGEVGEV